MGCVGGAAYSGKVVDQQAQTGVPFGDPANRRKMPEVDLSIDDQHSDPLAASEPRRRCYAMFLAFR
jgi:hypothetical protein